MQSKTQVYKTIIETLEYQMGKFKQGSTEKWEVEDQKQPSEVICKKGCS